MGKFKTFISGAVLSLFFGVSPVSAELFGLSSFVLDNGMQVLVIPNHKAPIIKHMVWYSSTLPALYQTMCLIIGAL